MKTINYKTIATLSLLVFVFLLGFSFSVQAYRINQQELKSPVSQYLRENYGVNSIEEYEAKLEQEIWLNISRQMEALASEYPEFGFDEWRVPDVYRQYGTSTYQQPKITSQQPFYAVMFSEPVTALQVFSLSGLGLIGLAAVPPIRKNKRLKQALVLGVVILCVFSGGYFVGLTVAQTWTTAIESGSFTETASYVVWTDGTYVYAKNGKTGAIDFKDTDASTVIQSAINALTNGGKIFIKAGTYNFGSGKYLSIGAGQSIELIGEEMNSVKFVKTAASGSTDQLITAPSTTNRANLTLKNIYFNTSAISVSGCNWINGYFTSFKAERCKGLGYAGDLNSVLFGCIDATKCIIKECEFVKYGYSTWIRYYDFVELLNNYAYDCGVVGLGVWRPNPGATINILGNVLVDCGWNDEGLVIDRGYGNPVVAVEGRIADNIVYNPTKPANNGNIAVLAVSGVVVENNFIKETCGPYDVSSVGILVSNSATYPMSNIIVRNNHVETYGRGITAKNAFDTRIYGNTVILSTGSTLRGIALQGDTNVPISGIEYVNDNTIIIESGGSSLQMGIWTYIPTGGGGTSTANIFRNIIDFKTTGTRYGINLQSSHSGLTTKIYDNQINNATYQVYNSGNAGPIVYLKNSGTATFSGNGSQTQFTIAHGLAGTPKVVVVTAGSNDAKGDFYVTYDATNIYVTYATAPPSGTNNVVLRWYAEM